MNEWRLRCLVGGRFVVGGAALLAPRLAGRVFGLPVTPSSAFVGRMFGVRAVGMGVAVAAMEGTAQDEQLRAGVVIDLVDAAAALALARHHRRAAAMAFAAAVWEASLGASLLSARTAVRSLPVEGTGDRDAGARAHHEDGVGPLPTP